MDAALLRRLLAVDFIAGFTADDDAVVFAGCRLGLLLLTTPSSGAPARLAAAKLT